MKRVLIISPSFPPVNAPDMQRIRMSLPYFKDCNWMAEVVCVDQKYINLAKDMLLNESLPTDVPIHRIKALSQKITGKIGLGSIALRSMFFYRKKVSELLKSKKFDLIYFSTTEYPLCILGAYWKKKFGVPYIIDMQDPWHSEYYQNKPKNQQPPKYWFSYRLNKWLEPLAMKSAAGLISVSQAYIDTLKQRYENARHIPSATIPFGFFGRDMDIADKHQKGFTAILNPRFKNIVYTGRGGFDMHKAITPFFKALKMGLKTEAELFSVLRIHFIGTSYAQGAGAKQTIQPLAEKHALNEQVNEIKSRIGFYHVLSTLQQADALFIPGSDDAQYTASKLYPYISAEKPLLAVFHPQSSAVNILKTCTNALVHTLDEDENALTQSIFQFLKEVATGETKSAIVYEDVFEKYQAREMTRRQVAVFNQVV